MNTLNNYNIDTIINFAAQTHIDNSSRDKCDRRVFSQLKHYIKKQSPNTYDDI